MPYYYLVIFLLLFFASVLEVRGVTSRTRYVLRLLCFFAVFATAAFKYETGVDWLTYTLSFDLGQRPLYELFEVGWSEYTALPRFELGYFLLSGFCKMFGNIQLLYFLLALINIIFLYKALTYFSPYPILCLLGYYCFVFFILDMSGVRQSVAVNIALYGMRYVCEKRWWRYAGFIVLAGLFHQTAYALLVIYPLFNHQRMPYRTLWVVYGLSVVVVILHIKWMQTGTSLVLPLLGSSPQLSAKITDYVFSSRFADIAVNPVKILFVLAILILAYMLRDRWKEKPIMRFSILMLFIYGILNNLLFEVSELNGRFTAYMIVFIAIVGTGVIQQYRDIPNRLLLSGIVGFYCFLYAQVYIMENRLTLPYAPYQNYLIHKVFDIPSTGEQRLYDFANKPNN